MARRPAAGAGERSDEGAAGETWLGRLHPAVSRSGACRPTDERSLALLSPRPVAQVLVLLAVLAVFAVTLGFGPAAAQTQTIDGCQEINESGTYELSGDVQGTDRCIDIVASGVTVDGNGYTLSHDGSGSAFSVSASVENVTIRDVTVRDWGRAIEVSDSGASNLTLSNGTVHGGVPIYWQGSDGVTVADSRFEATEGIDVGARDLVVSGNVVNGTIDGNHGIRVSGDGAIVEDNEVIAANPNGIFTTRTDGSVLDNNTIYDSATSGIKLGSQTSKLTVTNNTVYSTDSYGMHLGSAVDLRLENNTIRNASASGVSTDQGTNWTVASNSVYDNAGDGLELSSIDGLDVWNNTLERNGGHGASLTSSRDETFRENVFRSNGGDGLHVSTHRPQVVGNRFVDNTRGFYFDYDNATLRNNVFRNQSDAGVYVTGEMYASSLNGTVLRNNGVGIHAGAAEALEATNVDLGASTAPNTTVDFSALYVDVTGVTNPAEPPEGNDSIGRYVDAASTGDGSLFDFDLHYDDADLRAVNESTLEIRHDGGDGNWTAVDGSELDTGANLVSANVSSFGDFGAFAEAVTVPEFRVAIDDTNSQVLVNETLAVNATISNQGTANGTQNVTLNASGAIQDATEVSLNASENQSIALAWDTTGVDAGEYEVTVASENASVSADVTVREPASFDVSIAETDATVVTGGNATVTANVTNTGDVTGEQPVTVTVDGFGQVDAAVIALNASESRNVTLTWNTTGVAAADYDAVVASENDTATQTVTVLHSDAFEVTIVGTNDPITEGETLTVEANVSYEAEQNASQNVTLHVGELRDTTTVNFDGPRTKPIVFEWVTASDDAGEHTATVSTEDDTAVRSVTVEADDSDDPGGIVLPPSGGDGGQAEDGLAVSIDDTNAPVHVGEALAVEVTVSNPGTAAVTDSVALTAAGAERDSRSLTLAGNDSTTATLTWEPTADDVGEHPVTVASTTDSAIRYVTVEEAPTLDVAIADTNAPITAGRRLEVTARVTAASAVNETVELLDTDGDRVDASSLALEANESRTITLSWGTGAADAGSASVTVRGAEDADTAAVRIDDPAALAVEIVAADATVEVGETPVVEARIANTGDEATTGRARLVVGDEERAERRVRLGGGAETTVRLEWTPEQRDVGTADLRVDAGSGTDSRTVTVENDSGGGFVFDGGWSESAVDYEPTPRDTHVGGFAWLTALVGGLGAFVLVTRRSRDGRLLGATLLLAAARTTTDVLHASVAGVQTEQLLALNASLELSAALAFLAFAANYADHEPLRSRRGLAALAGVGVLGVAAAATNPVHGLVFGEVAVADGPFSYVTAESGPLGWVLLAATLGSLLAAVGLLVRSFLTGTDPAWRPVGVLASGLCLAVIVVLLSVLERGPLPQYDYTGAGVAGFLVTTTTTLFGHGLHRIKQTAQQSLIEDLDDPIVIANDARVVVESNAAARELLAGIEVGETVGAPFGVDLAWPDPGEATVVECSSSDLVAPSPAAEAGDQQPSTDGGVQRPSTDGGVQQPSTDDGDHQPSTEDGDQQSADDRSGAEQSGVDDTAADSEPTAKARDAEERATPAGGDGSSDDVADGEPVSAATDGDVERYYLVNTATVTADTGDTIGYTVRFTDVTELKRRKSVLASRNAQLEQVASTISHDLRNPMTVASGYVEQLSATTPVPGSEVPDPPLGTLTDSLEAVRESLNRMHDIIDDVLALARSDEPVSTDADLSFASVVSDAWATVDTDAANLSVASSGTIDADPQRLQRMLENLFRNAVEHGGEDVTVTVGLTEEGFSVADDGPGVPDDVGDAVFEQGYTSAQSGTGLGLSIVTQLARAHDWRVELDPDADGARFEFTGCETDVRHDHDDDPFETGELR